MGGLIPRCIPTPRQIEKIFLIKASQKSNNKETTAKWNEQKLTIVKEATHTLCTVSGECVCLDTSPHILNSLHTYVMDNGKVIETV